MANKKKQEIVERLDELKAMEATLLPEEKAEMEDLEKRLEKIIAKGKEEKTDVKNEGKDKSKENVTGKNDVAFLKGNVWYKGVHYIQGSEVDKASPAYAVFKEINLVD